RILIGLAIGLLASPGLAASFNCAKATQPIERAICAYPQLDRLDSLLGERLRSVLREQDKAERERRLAEQRAWLASREVQCPGYAEECLADLYRSRLQALAVSTPAVPFRAALPQHQLREAAPLCELPDLQLPDETLVYAAGAYSGRELDAQIDQSGHQATRFDILVNSPERPVALLLGAYEPSIWNIGWTEGTRILAVLRSEAAPLCELPDLQLPDETLVYAAGAYSGRELDAQIDQSGHQATRFDILVNSPERPVALLLGAYEPSIWNIGWTEGTRILAVL